MVVQSCLNAYAVCTTADNSVNSIMQEGMTFTVGMYLAVMSVT